MSDCMIACVLPAAHLFQSCIVSGRSITNERCPLRTRQGYMRQEKKIRRHTHTLSLTHQTAAAGKGKGDP
ncbi:hypothetical protein CSPX01_04999 [Colletotrichum filicis]|nr:hypothetical protein CSPX01_04999 [Colletotrichum filicis]